MPMLPLSTLLAPILLAAITLAPLAARADVPATLPAMPMPVDRPRTADARWLAKPVLQNRALDDMEDPATWQHRGAGTMTFAGEHVRAGKQSLRMTVPTRGDKPSRDGRPWGECAVRRVVSGEDWAAFNRLSIWVYPDMRGHKVGSVVIRLHNDGVEKVPGRFTDGSMHYALVRPGEWNRVVWEIDHLARDKVVGVDLMYRQQGSEPGAAETVAIDFDQLELQKVEPDYYEGWGVWPGRIAHSHTGYALRGTKTAIASDLKADAFRVEEAATGKVVLERPVKSVKTDLGQFQVLDFTALAAAGTYRLRAGSAVTPPFRVADDVWRETIVKSLNFFYTERCGHAIAGVHDVCHADWRVRHGERMLPMNGGWHDAGDLSQGLINTGEAVYAMFSLAERLAPTDPALAARMQAEAIWGLDWVETTRFGDGFRASWGTMDYWSDGVIGTVDDAVAEARDGAADNFTGAIASARGARTLVKTNPERAKKSLEIAKADWQFGLDRLKSSHPEVVSAGVLASVELFRATGEKRFAEKATELARILMDCQQREYPAGWAIPLVGYFHTSPKKDNPLTHAHRGHDQAAVVALAALCDALPEHADWMRWYSAVALHAEYLRAAAALNEPYGTFPAGVYAASGNNKAQATQGVKLSETHYLRRFPIWGDMRGHYGILLSQTKAMSAAARLRGRPELADVCHRQLEWVVGRNPFAQSTMYGEGHDYAPQYTAMSGDLVGSLPVGIQSRKDRDVPYWPVTNCWNYKEVWVHPSSRWLFAMADLAGPAIAEPGFDLTQETAADGTVTITASFPPGAARQLTLHGSNLVMPHPTQDIPTHDSEYRQAVWVGKVQSAKEPWVAVVKTDGERPMRQDVVGLRPMVRAPAAP